MSAEFESGVTFGAKSWHGMEVNLPAGDLRRRSVEGTLAAAGLDWTVSKHALCVKSDDPAWSGVDTADEAFGVFRDTDRRFLGVVGQAYQCRQNLDHLRFFQGWLDTGECEFETAGSLRGGKVVWALARIDEDQDVGGGDTITPYFRVASSHDGSMATNVGFVRIRTVCTNTLVAGTKDPMSKLLNVRHTARQELSLAAIRETIDLARQEFRANIAQYRKMMEVKLDPTELRRYVKLVMDAPEDDDAMSGRMRNQVRDVVNLCHDSIGAPSDQTVWRAYQGVSYWLTHRRTPDPDRRKNSLWFGSGAAMNNRAFDLALTLAS